MTTKSLQDLIFEINELSERFRYLEEDVRFHLDHPEPLDTLTIDGHTYVLSTESSVTEPLPLEGVVRTMDIYRREYGLSDGDIAKLTGTSVEQVKELLGKPLSAYLANITLDELETEDDPF